MAIDTFVIFCLSSLCVQDVRSNLPIHANVSVVKYRFAFFFFLINIILVLVVLADIFRTSH